MFSADVSSMCNFNFIIFFCASDNNSCSYLSNKLFSILKALTPDTCASNRLINSSLIISRVKNKMFSFSAICFANCKAKAVLPMPGRPASIINCPDFNPDVNLSILPKPV